MQSQAALEDPFTQALGRSAIPVAALTRDTGPSQELRRAVRDAILAGDVARLRVALRGLGQDVTRCECGQGLGRKSGSARSC